MNYRSAGGAEVPVLGFGTYNLYGETCRQAVRDALEMGYRHVDTAEFYDNHRPVGEGIAEASVPREDVFLTTKVWKTHLEADQVHDVVRTAVADLDVDYVDLLLVHWPNEAVPIEETMRAMNELQRDGNVRHVGVSNFSVDQLVEAVDASQTPIVTNQVPYNPRIDQRELLEFAIESGILLTAYSPLGKGDVLDEPLLRTIGDRYGKSPAQVALRWLVQQPSVLAIPKAESRDHRFENRQVFDFELTAEEMRSILELTGTVDPGLEALLDR